MLRRTRREKARASNGTPSAFCIGASAEKGNIDTVSVLHVVFERGAKRLVNDTAKRWGGKVG